MPHRVDVDRGHWHYPSADEIERQLLAVVRSLARDSAALGRLRRESGEWNGRRERVLHDWNRVQSTIALLRAETAKEAKRATRDALHTKLCELVRNADRDPDRNARPHVGWKRAIEGVLEWLDSWAS